MLFIVLPCIICISSKNIGFEKTQIHTLMYIGICYIILLYTYRKSRTRSSGCPIMYLETHKDFDMSDPIRNAKRLRRRHTHEGNKTV